MRLGPCTGNGPGNRPIVGLMPGPGTPSVPYRRLVRGIGIRWRAGGGVHHHAVVTVIHHLSIEANDERCDLFQLGVADSVNTECGHDSSNGSTNLLQHLFPGVASKCRAYASLGFQSVASGATVSLEQRFAGLN